MRRERQQRREKVGSANFNIEEASRSGKIVAELEHVSKAFEGRDVISDFSTIIQRGDRVGIVGANGAGKSTLVKLILGQLAPDSGTIKLGTKLEIAYSDQLRGKLEPEQNLIDNICGGQDFIEINGKRRHAISYLGDFLFSPERVRTPVKALSGGEQNRAILARLFSKPANLLVLDEPTNDLDVETLELLEDILLSFDGTVILVSHDRDFMDHVVTQLLILRGDGTVEEQAGGYSDWEARGGRLTDPASRGQQMPASKPEPAPTAASATAPAAPARRKLSYKEQRELEALPGKIEELEQQQAAYQAQAADPAFYQQGRDSMDRVLAELAAVEEALEAAIERWTELEG